MTPSDNTTDRAYDPAESPATVRLLPRSASSTADVRRRRPPQSDAEHERRVAWGKQWGAVGAEYHRRLKERQAR